jgi:hypothetical protein
VTREEFIDGYVKRSGIEQYRTATGYIIHGRERLALPCACGEECCQGWAMVSAESVDDHMLLYGQDGA